MKEQGYAVNPEELLYTVAEAEKIFMPRVFDYMGKMHEFWIQYDRYVLDKVHIQDPQDNISTAIDKGFSDSKRWFRVFPETRHVLSSLKERGYMLGVISNNLEGQIQSKLQALELDQYFDTVTYSQEAGASKPDPVIFRLALKRCGFAAKQCVHVGDNYEQDVIGALNVGINPVLIDRKGKVATSNFPRIENLEELLD